jgi:hypothetical protein
MEVAAVERPLALEAKGVESGKKRRTVWLAEGAIAGVVFFNVGWLLAEALQGSAYSIARHDVSDLAAMTARSPWVFQTAAGIAGALIIAFALFGLRRAFAGPGRHGSIVGWLVAASLIGLDNLSDAFFRLDCRAADLGCSPSRAISSWHGKIHVGVFVVSALATVAAAFALSSRMRRLDGWRDLARPAFAFAVVFTIVLLASIPVDGRSGGGILQRGAILLVSGGIVTMAVRLRALARSGRLTTGVVGSDEERAVEPRRSRDPHALARRALLMSGVATVGLVLAAHLLHGAVPATNASSREVIAFYRTHASGQLAGGALLVLAAFALLVLAGTLRAAVRTPNVGADGVGSTLGLSGAILLAVGLTIFTGMGAALADGPVRMDPTTILTLNVIYNDLFAPIALGIAAFSIGYGIAAVTSKRFPPVVGWLGIAIGVVALTPLALVALLALGVWILILGPSLS